MFHVRCQLQGRICSKCIISCNLLQQTTCSYSVCLHVLTVLLCLDIRITFAPLKYLFHKLILIINTTFCTVSKLYIVTKRRSPSCGSRVETELHRHFIHVSSQLEICLVAAPNFNQYSIQ